MVLRNNIFIVKKKNFQHHFENKNSMKKVGNLT